MLAPEPILRAYLALLGHVTTYVRARSGGANRIPDDQLFDLMDAVHNIPELLTRYGEFFSVESIEENFLKVYDDRWAKKGDLSLTQTLEKLLFDQQ